MEHHSISVGPVNRLPLAILGPPPVAKFSAGWSKFLFPDGEHAWIPDTAIMVLLLTAIVAIVFPLAARRFDKERPGGLQNFLEMIVDAIRGLLEDVIGHGAQKKYLPM